MSKQCLDVQQMQHLQELGLKMDYNTMLSWIVDDRGKDKPLLCISSEALDYVDFNHYCLPAYTLQDVLDELPHSIGYDEGYVYWLQIEQMDRKFDDLRVLYVSVSQDECLHCSQSPNLIDAAYELLVWCIERCYVETNKNE